MGVTLNTAYKVQADLLESESNIKIENGTLHVFDNKLKVHLNDEIKNVQTSNYKVFTALLTQSGESSWQDITSGDLIIGATYQIERGGEVGADFTTVGAPNNDRFTNFIATGTTPTWGTSGELSYNAGAPVATVLENTIGNIWFTYTTIGRYQINSSELFTTYKTTQFLNNIPIVEGDLAIFNNIDPNTLYLSSANSAFVLEDNYFNETPIEIRVYN